jgi:hypothetical protein
MISNSSCSDPWIIAADLCCCNPQTLILYDDFPRAWERQLRLRKMAGVAETIALKVILGAENAEDQA